MPTVPEALPNMVADLPLSVTHEVRDGCLCLHLQRAARAVARRFDDAFRPYGVTNGQFSILMSLNRQFAPHIGDVAEVLAMDDTTLTAALKPLRRDGLVDVSVDPGDRRSRLLHLTDAGREVLRQCLPIWRSTHADIEAELPRLDLDATRSDLRALSTRRPARDHVTRPSHPSSTTSMGRLADGDLRAAKPDERRSELDTPPHPTPMNSGGRS